MAYGRETIRGSRARRHAALASCLLVVGAVGIEAPAALAEEPAQPAAPAPMAPAPAAPAPETPTPTGTPAMPVTPATPVTPDAPAGEAPVTRILSLDEAVQGAIRANPTLEDAEAAIRRARGVVAETRGLRMPRLDTTSNFQLQGPIPVFTTVQPSPAGGPPITTSIPFGRTFTKTFNVTGSYNVDPFGRLRDNTLAARRDVEAVRASLFQTQNELVFSVQDVYLAALRARELIAVSTEAIDAAQEQLRVAEAQFRAGTAPEFDVLRASVQVSNNRQNLVAAQATYRRAVVALAQLLSLDANTRLNLVSVNLPPEPEAVAIATARDALGEDATGTATSEKPTAAPLVSNPTVANSVPRSLEGALNEAFRTRPEVYGAEWARRAAQARLSQQRRGNYPDLNLSAAFNYQPDQVGLAAVTETWTILANITLPIFDGGITRARVRQARADVASAQARIDVARDRVTQEVRSSLVDLEEATERRRAASANTTQAREALRIAQVRYTAGLAPNVEVTDAQVALTQARSNEVNAAYDYLGALANLNRSLGRYADDTLRQVAGRPGAYGGGGINARQVPVSSAYGGGGQSGNGSGAGDAGTGSANPSGNGNGTSGSGPGDMGGNNGSGNNSGSEGGTAKP